MDRPTALRTLEDLLDDEGGYEEIVITAQRVRPSETVPPVEAEVGTAAPADTRPTYTFTLRASKPNGESIGRKVLEIADREGLELGGSDVGLS
jgi:hypothetical protein